MTLLAWENHPSPWTENLTSICAKIVAIQESIETLIHGATVRNSTLYIEYTDELITVLHNIFPLLNTLREWDLDEALWVLCWCIASYRPEHSMIIIGIQARLRWIIEARKKNNSSLKQRKAISKKLKLN